MPTERCLPREALPEWVTDAMIKESERLAFYSWCIQYLISHGENMCGCRP